MAYVDYSFYIQNFKGNSVTEAEFPFLAERATDIINALIGYKITNIETLQDDIKHRVQLATCSLVETLDENGGTLGGTGSYSIGKFSVNNSITDYVPKSVYGYLETTGLLYRGI